MHYTEKILIHQLAQKYNLDKEMIHKLINESKNNSYQDIKESKRVANIESLIHFYISKETEGV
ncbi:MULTISPECIES: hypothetical protein [Halobacillus]|uniref:Uncharacterized protein n=1 Tax=Halobacillus faecis TaxID=360184 RepID=A0A511WQ68_9BACI|nr:hypothetical protein [Halobacillus faecis]GEN52408.1 hypothetical protein HFA01_06700 [Halobacillus faecis]